MTGDFAFFSFLWIRPRPVFDGINAAVIDTVTFPTSMTLVAAGAPGGYRSSAKHTVTLGDLYRFD